MFAARNGHEDVVTRAHQGRRRSEADQRRRPHGDHGRHRQRPIRSRREAARARRRCRTTARSTSPSTCTTRRPTCARTTARGCAPTIRTAARRWIWSSCCSTGAPIRTSRSVGQIHNTTLCCDPEVEQLAVLPRGDRLRRRSAEADARARREGRMESGRGEEEARTAHAAAAGGGAA